MSLTRRLAIYGGSFSPPHTGHVLAARAYLAMTEAEKLVIMPAKRPPHKLLDGMVADDARIEMCRLAFYEDEQLYGRCEVSEWEVLRDAVSYTVDTVEHFRSLGYEDICLLIGTDMLLTFESWYRYKDLFKYVTLCYIDRYDEKRAETLLVAERFRREYGARILSLDAPVFEVSSSEIRDRISRGESIHGLVPRKVEEYIIENSLYKRA